MPDSQSRSENTNYHNGESLVAQCQLYLLGIVRQVCKRFHRYPTPDQTEDYCDEILLLLLTDDDRYLKTFDPAKASLKTWLTALTEHELGYKFKLEKSWDSLDDTPLEQLLELPQQERNVITQEQREAVAREVAKLSARQQQLWELLCDDLSASEIAERLNIKAASVHRMKHELIQKIKKGIEKNGGANCVPEWASRKMKVVEKSESRFLRGVAILVVKSSIELAGYCG